MKSAACCQARKVVPALSGSDLDFKPKSGPDASGEDETHRRDYSAIACPQARIPPYGEFLSAQTCAGLPGDRGKRFAPWQVGCRIM